jgi:hypothetical protein
MHAIAILFALHVSQVAGTDPDWGSVVFRYQAPIAPAVRRNESTPAGERIVVECSLGLETDTPVEAEPDSLVAPVLDSSVAPNPFNPQTRISFTLPEELEVSLLIFDSRGECVRSLWWGVMTPGVHTLAWDGRDEGGRHVSSGVYFYRLLAGYAVETRRMVLLR